MADRETIIEDGARELAEERVEKRKARRRQEVDAYDEDAPAEESPVEWRNRALAMSLGAKS